MSNAVWLTPRYKEKLWEDRGGKPWRVDPNTNTRTEITPVERRQE